MAVTNTFLLNLTSPAMEACGSHMDLGVMGRARRAARETEF